MLGVQVGHVRVDDAVPGGRRRRDGATVQVDADHVDVGPQDAQDAVRKASRASEQDHDPGTEHAAPAVPRRREQPLNRPRSRVPLQQLVGLAVQGHKLVRGDALGLQSVQRHCCALTLGRAAALGGLHHVAVRDRVRALDDAEHRVQRPSVGLLARVRPGKVDEQIGRAAALDQVRVPGRAVQDRRVLLLVLRHVGEPLGQCRPLRCFGLDHVPVVPVVEASRWRRSGIPAPFRHC